MGKKVDLPTKEKANLSFSIDTSDDESFNESDKCLGESEKSINPSQKSFEMVNEKGENKRDVLVSKKALIDKENDLYNTVLVNKPDNPMASLNRLKEEKIRQKRKEIKKEKF